MYAALRQYCRCNETKNPHLGGIQWNACVALIGMEMQDRTVSHRVAATDSSDDKYTEVNVYRIK